MEDEVSWPTEDVVVLEGAAYLLQRQTPEDQAKRLEGQKLRSREGRLHRVLRSYVSLVEGFDGVAVEIEPVVDHESLPATLPEERDHHLIADLAAAGLLWLDADAQRIADALLTGKDPADDDKKNDTLACDLASSSAREKTS